MDSYSSLTTPKGDDDSHYDVAKAGESKFARLVGSVLVLLVVFPVMVAPSDGISLQASGLLDRELTFKDSDNKPATTPSPTSAPTPTPIGWVLAAKGQTCTDACAAAGGPGTCNTNPMGKVSSSDAITYVAVTALGHTCDTTEEDATSLAPYVNGTACYWSTGNSDCDATPNADFEAICCCGTGKQCDRS